ncbi:MAG: 6-carboxytetrahydropterin synthase [Halobacteriovoraceae bacterium]|jgi:6-pyruvoyltetrahydropterin/6-carboxytetrahydropterin synthase|nr:6-carboxytetrahydropterin synthase [Halobacteriovoraceae bacterium]
MENVECIRKLTFCAGHRVLGHESKCANAHGHNYSVFIHAVAERLDELGRVIDFSIIKQEIGTWLDTHWDHTFLVYEKDTELISCRNILEKNKEIFICDFNPTAENLALYLINTVCPDLLSKKGVRVTKIELHETENCKVIVEKK